MIAKAIRRYVRTTRGTSTIGRDVPSRGRRCGAASARHWVLLAGLVLAPTAIAAGQTPAEPAPLTIPAPAEPTADCAQCHLCDAPSSVERCLRYPCTRSIPGKAPADLGPDVVLLNQLEREYLPVPFDHRGHARMAEMGQGCAACHHFTPAGQTPPRCASCHDPAVAGTDPRKPGLKGAYHQQCLNCHREWIDETACEVCHRRKTGAGPAARTSGFPTTDELLKRIHPPIAPPSGEYIGRYVDDDGGRVIFRHQRHIDRFGLACVECHHEPSCARCHTAGAVPPPTRTVVEHHRPCLRCHKDDMDLEGRSAGRCEQCHWCPDAAKPEPFDHAAVGWSLGRFHENLGCRGCHTAVPFTRLEKRCDGCHGGWRPGTFRHAITGRELDETHAPFDCVQCHRDRRFDLPATCDECHDEDPRSRASP